MNFNKYHVSRNLVDAEEFAEGLVSNYGSITANENYITSDYIWFQTGIYTMSMINGYTGSGTTTNRIAVYNAQKEFIYCVVDVTENRSERPQYTFSLNNDCYLRIGVRKTDTELMLNTGSTALPYEPYGNTWTDIPHYIHNTSTDTITTLPADLYPTDTTATVGLKGNMEQNGTPTPASPIYPQECGELETVGEKAGQYKIPISSGGVTTPVYLGEIESTRRIKKLVLKGDETWTMSVFGGHNGFLAYAPQAQIGKTNCICSHYKVEYANTNYTLYFIAQPANGRFIIFDDRFSSSDDFKTYIAQQYAAGTPVTIWYVLAEPETGIVNEPIRKIGDYADTVSGISIPTITGANSFDILTTLKPSEVTVNYKGWHSVANVHERENGAWT